MTSAPPVGLYRTIDGNKLDGEPTWVHLNSMLEVGDANPKNIFEDLPITSIALSPTDSNVILVATAGARPGLFRSSDGGATWTYLSGNAASSLPNGTVTDFAYAPSSNTVFAAAITVRKFFVGLATITEPNNADLFVSTDGRATWESTELPALPGFEVDNVRIALQQGTGETIVYTGVVKNGRLSSLDRLAWPDPVAGELQIGSWVGVNLPPAFTIASVGFGIQTIADELGKLANGPLEGLAPELLAMTNAERQTRNDRVLRTFAPDGAAQHFGDVAYQSTPSNSVPLLRRLIESGSVRLTDTTSSSRIPRFPMTPLASSSPTYKTRHPPTTLLFKSSEMEDWPRVCARCSEASISRSQRFSN